MSCTPWRRILSAAILGVVMLSRGAYAQTLAGTPATYDPDTRPALESQLKNAEAQHRTAEAWMLRTRLEHGDFQDGDKILIKLLGNTTMIGATGNDTVTVRAGKLLPLPQMEDLPLEGVLRSELTPKLQAHLSKYLRDASVRATPLIRLAVLGQVRVPGYYYTPTDVLLSELIMKAGGPLVTADVGNMVIRRGPEVLWTAQDTRTALADGVSLERLHLQAGDEVYLDDIKGSIDWKLILQIGVSTLGTIIGLFYTIKRL